MNGRLKTSFEGEIVRNRLKFSEKKIVPKGDLVSGAEYHLLIPHENKLVGFCQRGKKFRGTVKFTMKTYPDK